MIEKYGVVFSWDEEYEGYVAEAVGLPGCFSQGKTMEEAIENIKDAIKGYLYVERKHESDEFFSRFDYDLSEMVFDRDKLHER